MARYFARIQLLPANSEGGSRLCEINRHHSSRGFLGSHRAGHGGRFKFSSLLSLESGRPFNVFAGSDANRDGNPLSDRPGNLDRNSLAGPGYASFDMRVARPFHLGECLRAELSADLFGDFNRTNVKDLKTL